MPSLRKRLRYKLEFFGLAAAAKIVPLFPRSLCLFVARALGTLASVFDRPGRKVALENLELALPNELDRRRRHRVMRASFRYFAQTMLDLLWSPRLTNGNFRKYIELENFEEIERHTGP